MKKTILLGIISLALLVSLQGCYVGFAPGWGWGGHGGGGGGYHQSGGHGGGGGHHR